MLPQQILLHFVQATASKGVQHRRDALPSTRKKHLSYDCELTVHDFLFNDIFLWKIQVGFCHTQRWYMVVQSGFNAPSLHQVHQQRLQCRHQPSATTTLSCFVHGGAAEAFKLVLHGTRLFTLKTLEENI